VTKQLFRADTEDHLRGSIFDYQAGAPGKVDFDLVKDIVQEYLKDNGDPWIQRSFSMGRDLRSRIRSQEELDGQGFIDAVILQLEKEVDPAKEAYVDFLLNPLVKILYEMGHDSLTFDYQSFGSAMDIGHDVGPKSIRDRGGRAPWETDPPPNHPLFLQYILPHNSERGLSVGEGARSCTMKIIGQTSAVGRGADACKFHLQSIPGYIGRQAHFNSFYIANVEKVSPVYRVGPKDMIGHSYAYKLYLQTSIGERKIFLGNNFFYNHNRLIVPESSRKTSLIRRIHRLGNPKLIPHEEGWVEVQL